MTEKKKTKIYAGTIRLTHEGSMFLAMEWGYMACEQGMNIQRAKQEFNKVLREGIL
jgi:hypothetical protein